MRGVQLETCSEGGQDAGFIDATDYIEWRIAVPSSGSYALTSRSASTSQASYAVSVDGNQVTTKTIPSTGGWQTWQSFTTAGFNMTAGTHTLRVTFTSGGQNLNYAKVAPTSVPWTGTWAAAPQNCGTSFQNQTIRNVVHTSIGGARARVQLSNVFGAQPATFRHVQIAKRASGSSIVAGTTQTVTFGGASETTVAVGGVAVSDPINFTVDALSDVVVSFYLPNATGNASCHGSAFQDNYVVAGDHSADTSLASPQVQTSYFYLANLDVQNTAAVGAVVTLGASITDGYITSSNANRRWPNYLATRLTGAGRTVGVLNQGISGNKLLVDGSGQSALHRFARDVLAQPNVKWVIFSDDPINDLGTTAANGTQLIDGLKQLISQAHANGIKFYCSTLTPYEGAGYWTSGDEVYREQINDFIRGGSSGCDGIVDQDLATHDPNAPTRYLPAYDAGDHLHPNESGMQAIANSVNLTLFDP
jgi:lysophospholipase L1-like esterase